MTRHTTRGRVAALLAVALLVASTTGPAAAATADDEGLVSVSVDDLSSWNALEIAATAAWENAGLWLEQQVETAVGGAPKADRQAEDLQQFLTDHSGEFVDHTNSVLAEYNASVQNTTYVLEVSVVDERDDPSVNETFYVVATGDGENVTSLSVPDSTNATVDRHRTLTAYEARELNEDVREYYRDYVVPGETPTPKSLATLAATHSNLSEIEVQNRWT